MAHRNDEHPIHYTSVLPATNHPHHHHRYQKHLSRKTTDLPQSRPLYVEVENAFQDQNHPQDHFGFEQFQSIDEPANFHLQSVEMISEVQNRNVRHYSSRETSHSSTPLNQSPYPFQYNQIPYAPASNTNLLHRNFHPDYPQSISPDPIQRKIRTNESQPMTNLTLPQYFLVKYLGRTACSQIWGSKAVRTPIDEMVHSARQLPSMNELPTLEATVNSQGLTLTHRQSPSRPKHHHHHHHSHSPDRSHYGLIPLENISYAMHDVKYSKIASCIVLRQAKSSSNDAKTKNRTTETVTECYVFLFQSRDDAHRFALSLAQAFHGEKQNSRPSRVDGSRPPDHQHRSKHRYEKQRTDYHPHFKDSQV